LLVAVTKCDQVPKNRMLGAVRRLERTLKLEPGTTVACSSKTGMGKDELLSRFAELSR